MIDPTILLAAGRREDDPASLWQALLEAVPGPDSGAPSATVNDETSGTGASVVAMIGVDASIAAMERLLELGHSRLIVIPLGADGGSRAPEWQPALTDAVEALRHEHPEAEIHDAGRSGQASVALAGVLSAPRNDSPALLAGAIARGFDGDPARLGRFLAGLRAALPAETRIALRGSAVLGRSYVQGTPFDGAGPRTSDLDVVALGDPAIDLWVPEARLLGGINTLPLCDEAPWVAPSIDGARRRAQEVIRRPLSIQAMAGWFLDLRAIIQGQPYVVLAEPS